MIPTLILILTLIPTPECRIDRLMTRDPRRSPSRLCSRHCFAALNLLVSSGDPLSADSHYDALPILSLNADGNTLSAAGRLISAPATHAEVLSEHTCSCR